MRCQVKMPKVGDAVDKVTVVSISAAVGDRIAVGQELLVVETDKSNVEVPSPFAGRVAEILVKPGEEVSTGALIVVLEA
jgi:pyruvate/2-oxoglutarate dehydrogenase complex dihydrolipoamide acyltransferase (E2) component